MTTRDPIRRAHATDRRRRRPGAAGFTLVELLITLFIIALVIVGVLALFDLNSRLARVQTNVSELQQSIRIAQYDVVRTVRMAGRGGLPRGALPQGLAVAVRNDVPAAGDPHHIAEGDTDSPQVLAGTDVVTIRGVIDGKIFQVNPAAGNLSLDDPDTPTAGALKVQNPNPNTGVPQDLAELREAVTKAAEGNRDALLLVSPLDDWAVVEIDPESSDIETTPDTDVTIGFRIGTVGGNEVRDRYAALTNGFPPALRTVAFAGILEEHRFYVREQYAGPDKTGDLTPMLSRARFYPNTEIPHHSRPTMRDDIADNVFDLQVALGVDTDFDEEIREGDDAALARKDDDWLFNSPDDVDPADSSLPAEPFKWTPAAGPQPRLYYVRINTVARTDRRDPNYQAELLEMVEDKDYAVDPHKRFNERTERMFRRRLLQTVVDLRNVS